MDDSDNFFTQTIVGSPCSLVLGRRVTPADAAARGLRVDLRTGHNQLSQHWHDWMVLQRPEQPAGRPWRRPGSGRRVLERHALLVAATGVLGLVATAAWAAWLRWA